MEYKEQLKDPRWLMRRREIKERDNHRCMLCGTDYGMLNVHHLLYRNGCKAWEYRDTELATLCEECHKWVHVNNKKFIVRRSRITEKHWLCIENPNISKIQTGTVMTSDYMGLIIACADVPLYHYQSIQNSDGSMVDPSMYSILEEVETQVSVQKDGSGLAFNEYILPIDEVGLRPATEDEKKILTEALRRWLK